MIGRTRLTTATRHNQHNQHDGGERMAGQMTLGSAALSGLVRPASAAPDDAHRTLPVPAELRGLLPGRGLRRGSTVAVGTGPRSPSGGTSLVHALIAEASRAGSWCAVVGVPAFGAVAAADGGVALERLALVPNPGPEWATVVAALIDGVDVVVLAVPTQGAVASTVTARLAARARQRGSVLVPYGQWDGADLTLRVTRGRWEGLSAGRGRLRRREVTIVARGRGAATQPREITVWMPGYRPLTGTVAIAPFEPVALPALHAVPDPTPPAAELPGPPSGGDQGTVAGGRVMGRAPGSSQASDRGVAADGREPGDPRASSGSGLPASAEVERSSGSVGGDAPDLPEGRPAGADPDAGWSASLFDLVATGDHAGLPNDTDPSVRGEQDPVDDELSVGVREMAATGGSPRAAHDEPASADSAGADPAEPEQRPRLKLVAGGAR
ncbi:hypothetical protein Ais01nite_61340 [Asanoa ishikariensis]|uniref:Uncharacterized protein n=1 Tax=Asanoa ishikariensis TaxID=137265 RepID=A0A1H3P7G1_9ACTN|nr:hypothetical protein Ais01nite_61340 [Asanoa ishikariensis]SDY96309.1 hypothetical protein SAMN05421684_2594 [Asanoa ishikariensis]